jgi:hypothetical protein
MSLYIGHIFISDHEKIFEVIVRHVLHQHFSYLPYLFCRNTVNIYFKANTNDVCFLLGNSPASEFYIPTFRNTVPSSNAGMYVPTPIKMEQTECSETSTYKIQTPGNYPEESVQHSEHGESLKSRNTNDLVF